MAAMIPLSKSTTESKAKNANLSIGEKYGVSGGVSESQTETYSVSQTLDLNGDRFPDWLNLTDNGVEADYTGFT